LGRSSNDEGFLIEAPQSDGSRWIGLVSWATGEIRWLVQDEHVNAFASLGPDGRLAWSRRTAADGRFELVVQRSGQSWTLGDAAEDWLLPHWSGRDDSLFVLRLRDDRLDLAHIIAASPAAARQSQRVTPIAAGANVYIAYQSMASTVTTVGLPRPLYDQVPYVDPAHSRAAVWRPFAAGGAAPILLEPESLAAVPDETDVAYVTTLGNLMRQSLANEKLKARLLAGTIIPRRVNNASWHSVLLAPQEGRIGLSAIRLLPPER
jgi:hypothetical protein